jgi:hypothetical protein
MLTRNTKMRVYQVCVLSMLLYGSESWTLYMYSHQERKVNAFHIRNLRHLLGITWQDRVTNTSVLAQAGMPSLFAILSQRRLCWLGHVCLMEDSRIPKDSRPTGRPTWRAKVKEGIKSAEEKRTSRHQRTQPVPTSHTTPTTAGASTNAAAGPE